MTCSPYAVADAIAAQFQNSLRSTVALGGSRASGHADDNSDIDLHIYCRVLVALEARAHIISAQTRAKYKRSLRLPGLATRTA